MLARYLARRAVPPSQGLFIGSPAGLHFVAPVSTEESEHRAERTELHMRERGYGVWALGAHATDVGHW